MARTGRPKHKISKEEFEKLCGIQASQEEIAAWFMCEIATMQRWVRLTYKKTFKQIFEEKRGVGKISLRRSMFQQALKGQPQLAIFLAKNHLKMVDKIENTTVAPEPQSAQVPAMTKEEAQKLLDERCKVVPPKP